MITPKALMLLDRALREDARALTPHIMRLSLAAVMMLTVFFFAAQSVFRQAPGRELFLAVTWIDFLLVAVIGTSQFATTIVEEKEARSIGLLRMAGVSSLALILGKLIGRLWSVLVLLLVQLPFTVLAVTLGGVALEEVIAAFVGLVAFVIGLAHLSLVCSLVAKSRRVAAGSSTLITILVLFGGYLVAWVWWLLTDRLPSGPVWSVLTGPSAWDYLLDLSGRAGFGMGGEQAQWWNHPFFLWQAGFVVVGFTFTMLFFRRYAVDTGEDEGSRSKARPGRRVLGPGSAPRSAGVWGWPVVWKDTFFHLGGWRGLLIRLAATAGTILLVAVASDWDGDDAMPFYLLLTLFWPGFQGGWHGARLFGIERQANGWGALVLTPWKPYAWYWQKLASVFIHMAPMLVAFAVAAFVADGREITRELDEPWLYIMVWWFFLAAMIFIHLACWYALMVPWGAFALAFATMIVAIPVVGMLLGLLMMAFAMAGGRGTEELVAVLLSLPLLGFLVFLHWHSPRLIRWRAAID